MARSRKAIYKRDPGVWRVFYDLPPAWQDGQKKRRQRNETVRGSYRDAERRLSEIKAALSSAQWMEPARVTVAEWLSSWLTSRINLAENSRLAYHHAAREYIAPALGSISLQKLQPEQVTAWVAAMLRRYSPWTVRMAYNVLHQACRAATRRRPPLLSANPVDGAERPRIAKSEIVFYDLDEITAILAACERYESREWARFTKILLGTGMRQGEALGLSWPYVDFETPRISVMQAAALIAGGYGIKVPKTPGSVRSIHPMPFVIEALREQQRWEFEQRSGYVVGPGLVFPQEDGSVQWRSAYRRHWEAITKLAGVRYLHPHALRDTYATWALGAGVGIKVVSEALGHTSPAFTLQHYAGVLPNLQAQSGALMMSALVRSSAAEKQA